jgi:hypothetical protein
VLTCNIKVGRKNEKGALFPTTKPIVMARLANFGILEGGTETGGTSVCWTFELADKMLLVETSAEIFRGMAAALEKAERQFRDEPVDG